MTAAPPTQLEHWSGNTECSLCQVANPSPNGAREATWREHRRHDFTHAPLGDAFATDKTTCNKTLEPPSADSKDTVSTAKLRQQKQPCDVIVRPGHGHTYTRCSVSTLHGFALGRTHVPGLTIVESH